MATPRSHQWRTLEYCDLDKRDLGFVSNVRCKWLVWEKVAVDKKKEVIE